MTERAIGFIGLGDMGRPMATRLLDHGWRVVSSAHRRREAIEALRNKGLREVAGPREVAAAAAIVITMVRDTSETERLILGADGVLAGMGPGATLVIMSTIDPDSCRRIADEATERGVAVLDSPVSGLPMRAREGTLALMVGGDEAVIERCREPLEAMGRIFPCGGVGMGTVAKLANNAVLLGTVALLQEARALARAYGMPRETLMEVFAHASANSFLVQNWETFGANWDNYMALLIKDAGICLEAAAHKGAGMPLVVAASAYDWDGERRD